MVEINHGHRRPPAVVFVGRLPELRGWTLEGERIRLGAGLTYTDLLAPELATLVPGLAQAARTVGSPQIRNAGTLGGNVGTASPAGDTLPVLAALDAVVTLQGSPGARRVPLVDLITGPKRTSIGPGELITAVEIPIAGAGDVHEYLKVGTRNAMVIAVASVALVCSPRARTVRVALGSVGPVPIRAEDAESWVSREVDWETMTVAPGVSAAFADRVVEAARPIDDHRSTAAYRLQAVRVLARRALDRAIRCAPAPA